MDDTTKSMSLVNPVTGVQYRFPPTPKELVFDFHDRYDGIRDDSCLSADGDDDGICVRKLMKDHYISDVFMSSAPNSGAECLVMAKQRGLGLFVFCRPGDAVWTPVGIPYEIYQVVAFWNGRFYAVDHDENF
ncbi:putative F-box protein SKIP23-like [Cocos nucifera]|uniref:Putative F-box protein SKIP23-like n=1 Tax=Cocos nucifera TaxID=13894 RepID=A0A8K0IKK8_COCNU|nr:putative F-box protein SKIP23-like [Cocos nucifera]KAG1361094.1 putative F-box protein SKIP23-like [Cocos nucifera]KAG1361096.1 putative F-box protein SKIP23-like [Cocos nucifera]